MGAAAPVFALAGTGLQAVGDVAKARGTQAADSMQASVLRTKAEYAGAAAAETNATLTDRLATSLGNLDVVRAAGHTDPSSPTTLALRSRSQTIGNQEKAIRVGNIMAQQSEDLAGASYLDSAGKYAMDMGYVGAAADVAGALGKTNPGTFGLPGPGPASGDPTQIGALY